MRSPTKDLIIRTLSSASIFTLPVNSVGYRWQLPRKECLLKVWALACATSALFLTTPAHALTIVPSYGPGDSPVTPAEQASIADAITTIESTYQSNVTVQILFQNENLTAVPGNPAAQSLSTFYAMPYATYVGDLTQHFNTSHNTVMSSVLANLQHGNGANGASPVAATSAEWRNLGEKAAPQLTAKGAFVLTGGTFDGRITLNSAKNFNFAGIKLQPSNTLDPVATFEHEIDEVLGGGDSGTTLQSGVYKGSNFAFGPTDLLRYAGFQMPSYSLTAMSFLSLDGGLTHLADLIPGFGDFITTPTGPQDAQGSIYPGKPTPYTPTDIAMMEAIGYNTAVTPLPAALPLFATGIGGLGLLGWRRKRKARAGVA